MTPKQLREQLNELDTEMQSIFSDIFKSKENNHILYGLPGTGKSVGLCITAINEYNHVIMAKTSNQGCKELHQTLIDSGLVDPDDIEMNLSLEERLHDRGIIGLPTRKRTHEFDYDRLVDRDSLIAEIKLRMPSKPVDYAADLIDECTDSLPDFRTKKLTIMTQARYKALCREFDKHPSFIASKTLVVIDDPLHVAISDYSKVDVADDNNALRSNVKLIKGHHYHIRGDADKLCDINPRLKTVYTSAEILINKLIQSKCTAVLHEVKTKCPPVGTVHLVVTSMVSRDNHFMLKVFTERVNKFFRRTDTSSLKMIGDGIGSYTDTLNQARGSNAYTNIDVAAKVSDKHLDLLMELSLDLDMDTQTINRIYCLDDTIQMIGRKGGWRQTRSKSKKAEKTSMIIFANKNAGKYISTHCPYTFTTETFLTRVDVRESFRPTLPDKKDAPIDMFMWLIQNVNHYIEFGCTDKKGGGTTAILMDITNAIDDTKPEQRKKHIDIIIAEYIDPRIEALEYQILTTNQLPRTRARLKNIMQLKRDILKLLDTHTTYAEAV